MKGILNMSFSFLNLSKNEIEEGYVNIDQNDVYELLDGEEVEILKVIDSDEFIGKKGYVIYSPKTFESATISSMFVNLIEE